MTALRSLVFNALWYVNLALQMILQSPLYFLVMDHAQRVKVPKRWARSSHWLQKHIVGTGIEVQGRENLPTGAAIVACKHQSVWEFYGMYELLPDAAFVLKAELMKIPFFGWYVAALDHIPIRRSDKGNAMRKMLDRARREVAKGRQILIFPEGTRKAPGQETDYRYGVTRMYLDLGVPVVPVALDSGLFWKRRSFARFAGTLRVRALEPIQPGLDGPAFMALLEQRIEEGVEDLYLETSRDAVQPPMPEAVRPAIARALAREQAKAAMPLA